MSTQVTRDLSKGIGAEALPGSPRVPPGSGAVGLLNASIRSALEVRHALWTKRGGRFVWQHEVFRKSALVLDANVAALRRRIEALGGGLTARGSSIAPGEEVPICYVGNSTGCDPLENIAARLRALGAELRRAACLSRDLNDPASCQALQQFDAAVDRLVTLVEARAKTIH